MTSIRLVALDIDGTLLDSKFQISAANVAAIARAHERGIEIVIGTGRRHAFALPVAEKLGTPAWIISSNGAVTKSSTGELFHRDLLPTTVAREFCAYMHEYRRNSVLTFDRNGMGSLVIESADELNLSIRRWMDANERYIQHVSALEDALGDDPIQAMVCGPIARMKQAEKRLIEAPFINDVTVLKTEYEARDLTILDTLNRDCSKGHALARLASHRGYARDEIVAIGDNYNDLAMLEIAGHPFVMENASEDMKSRGFRLTTSNDHSGVAAALEMVGI